MFFIRKSIFLTTMTACGQQHSSTVDLRYYLYAPWSYAGGATLANFICTINTTGTKLVATATSLEGSKRELQIYSPTAIVLPSVLIR